MNRIRRPALNYPTIYIKCCSPITSNKRWRMSESNIGRERYTIQREEFEREGLADAQQVVQKPLSLFERVYNQSAVRKIMILVVLAGVWQVYASNLGNPLLFPKFSSTVM